MCAEEDACSHREGIEESSPQDNRYRPPQQGLPGLQYTQSNNGEQRLILLLFSSPRYRGSTSTSTSSKNFTGFRDMERRNKVVYTESQPDYASDGGT